MILSRRRVLGWTCIASAVLLAAFALVMRADPGPDSILGTAGRAPEPTGADVPSASIIVMRGEGAGATRGPSAEDMAAIRSRATAELEALVPPGGERVPTTSGVAYTLGMRGASLAMLWPAAEGSTWSCLDAHASANAEPHGAPSRETRP